MILIREENPPKTSFEILLYSYFCSKEPPTKSTKLKAIDGKEMLALDVYSAVIKYVKDLSLRDLVVSSGLSLTDIRWVLIVPANWDTSARRFMKKAAESVIYIILFSNREPYLSKIIFSAVCFSKSRP